MKGDVDWLTENIAQAVGWDKQSAEGVAEAIAAAGSRQEVDELAQVMHHAINQQKKSGGHSHGQSLSSTWQAMDNAVCVAGLLGRD